VCVFVLGFFCLCGLGFLVVLWCGFRARGKVGATSNGNSNYHGLQPRAERASAGGLNFLATIPVQDRSDAGDLLNNEACKLSRPRRFPVLGSEVTTDWPRRHSQWSCIVARVRTPVGKGKDSFPGASGLTTARGRVEHVWSATLQVSAHHAELPLRTAKGALLRS